MNSTNICRFCSVINGHYDLGYADTPIMQSNELFIIPDAGAMLDGWILIIPTVHCYSMRNYYSKVSFMSLFSRAITNLGKVYNTSKIVFFEHGANTFDSLTSCGTNHAHIHMMPTDFSILGSISKKLLFKAVRFEEVNEYVKDSEYLLYGEYDVKSEELLIFVALLTKPISQFFRREIANRIGCPDKYDYKANLNTDIADRTFLSLTGDVQW